MRPHSCLDQGWPPPPFQMGRSWLTVWELSFRHLLWGPSYWEVHVKPESHYSCQNHSDWQLGNLIMHFHRIAAKLWLAFRHSHLQEQHFSLLLKNIWECLGPASNLYNVLRMRPVLYKTKGVFWVVSPQFHLGDINSTLLSLGQRRSRTEVLQPAICFQDMTHVCPWPLKNIPNSYM